MERPMCVGLEAPSPAAGTSTRGMWEAVGAGAFRRHTPGPWPHANCSLMRRPELESVSSAAPKFNSQKACRTADVCGWLKPLSSESLVRQHRQQSARCQDFYMNRKNISICSQSLKAHLLGAVGHPDSTSVS